MCSSFCSGEDEAAAEEEPAETPGSAQSLPQTQRTSGSRTLRHTCFYEVLELKVLWV